MTRQTIIIVAMLIVITFPGCTAVKTGTEATVGYVRSEYTQFTARKVPAVCSASIEALGNLGVTISEQACDGLTGRIIARNSQDAKITIKINRTGEDLTRVSIQIGAMGDTRQSQAIYSMIQKRL